MAPDKAGELLTGLKFGVVVAAIGLTNTVPVVNSTGFMLLANGPDCLIHESRAFNLSPDFDPLATSTRPFAVVSVALVKAALVLTIKLFVKTVVLFFGLLLYLV